MNKNFRKPNYTRSTAQRRFQPTMSKLQYTVADHEPGPKFNRPIHPDVDTRTVCHCQISFTSSTHKYSFSYLPYKSKSITPDPACGLYIARSISLYYTLPYDINSTVVRTWISEREGECQKHRRRGSTKNKTTKTTKRVGERRVTQDKPSAPSSFRISASLSIFLSWVASRRSPRAAFSFSSSIALS